MRATGLNTSKDGPKIIGISAPSRSVTGGPIQRRHALSHPFFVPIFTKATMLRVKIRPIKKVMRETKKPTLPRSVNRRRGLETNSIKKPIVKPARPASGLIMAKG